MAYYLGRYAGTGSGFANPFKPDGVTGPFSSIDLRPDPTVVDGDCLLWTPSTIPNPILHGLIELGDDPSETLSFILRQRVENRLGITFDRDGTIGELASQILLNHAREDGTRWRALRFQRHQRTDPGSGFLALYRAIYLGAPGERVWEQYVTGGPGTVFTETWPGANNDSPDGDEDWTETLSDWDVVGNELHLITAAEGAVRAEVDLASDDHYAEAEYVGGSSPGSFPAVCCRFAAAASTYYIGYIESSSGTQDTFIYKYITGTPTEIQASTGEGLAAGNTIRMEVDGSDLDLMRNGVSTLTGTDTGITGNVRVGLGGFNAGASQIQFDNFEGGDLGAPPPPGEPLNRWLLDSGEVTGFKVDTWGLPVRNLDGATDATATPATISRPVGIPAASVTASADKVATTISRPVQIPTPTAIGGTTVLPATISLPAGIPTPTVTASSSVSPATISRPVGIPAVTKTASADKPATPVNAPAAIPQATTTASALASPVSVPVPVLIPAVTKTATAEKAAIPVNVIGAIPAVTKTATATVIPNPVNAPASVPQALAFGEGAATATPATVNVPAGIPLASVQASVTKLVTTVTVLTTVPPTTNTATATVQAVTVILIAGIPAVLAIGGVPIFYDIASGSGAAIVEPGAAAVVVEGGTGSITVEGG